jgi:hypothetical protein
VENLQEKVRPSANACPRCSSSRIRKSHRRNVLESILVILRGDLKRCEVCNTRFVRWGSRVVIPAKFRESYGQAKLWALVLAGLLVAVYLLVRMAD